MSVNKVILVGRLGQDPELKYTQSQIPVANFSLATSKRFKGENGQPDTEKTEWHRIVLWRKDAENAAKYLTKGSLIYLEGELQTRSWDDKDGKKVYTTEILGHVVDYLSRPVEKDNQAANNPNNSYASNNQAGYPPKDTTPQSQPSTKSRANTQPPQNAVDASMDEIPF